MRRARLRQYILLLPLCVHGDQVCLFCRPFHPFPLLPTCAAPDVNPALTHTHGRRNKHKYKLTGAHINARPIAHKPRKPHRTVHRHHLRLPFEFFSKQLFLQRDAHGNWNPTCGTHTNCTHIFVPIWSPFSRMRALSVAICWSEHSHNPQSALACNGLLIDLWPFMTSLGG